jgi:hypothetical protein
MRAVLLLRVIVAAVLVGICAGGAAADGRKLALLPLDAPPKLAIYGQPVAAEIARALTAAGLDVVVVGAQMAVPGEAVLVIEGSLSSVRKKVKVELRLRTLDSRTPLATFASKDVPLDVIDRAAAEVASALLPQLQSELEKRASSPRPSAPPPPETIPAPAPTLQPALLAVAAQGAELSMREAFVEQIRAAAATLPGAAYETRKAPLLDVSPASVMAMSAAASGALTLAFDVRELVVADRGVFVGGAKVRVLVARGGRLIFDRQLTTDTVVGARKGNLEGLLGLLAREVVAILRPRYLRTVERPEHVKAGGRQASQGHAAR